MSVSPFTGLPEGTKPELMVQASRLMVNLDRAIAFPLGGSTFRAVSVDRNGTVINSFEVPQPAAHYEDLAHAMAAAQVYFGCRPMVGAAFLAGPVPRRGLLQFANLHGWPAFNRYESEELFGFKVDWFNDGPAGYYGLPMLNTTDFAVLQEGTYQPGDLYRYAIFGTGLNIGGPDGREEGQAPFVPRNPLQAAFQQFLMEKLGYLPEWEAVASGGYGFRHAAEFLISRMSSYERANDDFVRWFHDTTEEQQGKLVTDCALRAGNPVAIEATRLVLEILGTWLGTMAVTSVASRIDISNGILGWDTQLREFCLRQTDFLAHFREHVRPMFSEISKRCTLRVCLRNPEHEGAVGRAAQLLRAVG